MPDDQRGEEMELDIAKLAQAVTAAIVPFLPQLTQMGGKALEAIGEKSGEAAWETAKALWQMLWPKVQRHSGTQKAVNDAATSADDDATYTLRWQLKKLLAEDTTLASELAAILNQNGSVTTVTASGDRSVAAGTINNSTIVTGDCNALK